MATEDLNNSSLVERYDWKDSEGNIPAGWKYRIVKISPSCHRIFFIAPDGTSLVGKVQAIEFMQKNKFSEEEIKAFATDIIFLNGCKEDPNLPEGWKFKRVKQSGGKKAVMFLPHNSINFLGKKLVIEFMKKNKTNEKDFEKVVNFGKKISRTKLQHVEHTWMSDDTVPQGWKYRSQNTKNGRKIFFYKTPEGLSLAGKIQAINYMKRKNYAPFDFRKMKSGSNTSKADLYEWKADSSIPTGWKLRVVCSNDGRSRTLYLPPNGTSSLGRLQAMKQMEIDNFSKDDINKLDICSRDWISSNPNLPEGWKFREGKLKTGYLRLFFMTEDGLKLIGKKQLFEYFKENKFDEDVVRKANVLFVKGANVLFKSKLKKAKLKKEHTWQVDESVPDGWKYRTVRGRYGSKTKIFQTTSGLSLFGRKAAFKYMKERKYCAKDLEKIVAGMSRKMFKSLQSFQNQKTDAWEEDENIPPGWKFKSMKDTAGERIDNLVDRNGQLFTSRVDAIQSMITEDLDPEIILKIWKTLKHEGWLYEKGLPHGWRVKRRDKLFIFLSPQMEMLNSLTEIEGLNMYDEELVSIRTFLGLKHNNYNQETLDECSDIKETKNKDKNADMKGDEDNSESKKVPQDWDKEVGVRLFKRGGNFLCSECEFSTLIKLNAISHVQSNHLVKFVGYECDECGKNLTTIKTLESHMMKTHAVTMPKYLARRINIL